MDFPRQEAGYKNLFTGESANASAKMVNDLDDLSVAKAALSTPFTSDPIPKLYPELDQQAKDLIDKYGHEKIEAGAAGATRPRDLRGRLQSRSARSSPA